MDDCAFCDVGVLSRLILLDYRDFGAAAGVEEDGSPGFGDEDRGTELPGRQFEQDSLKKLARLEYGAAGGHDDRTGRRTGDDGVCSDQEEWLRY